MKINYEKAKAHDTTTYPQNDYGASYDIAAPISSHLRQKPLIALLFTMVKSDLPSSGLSNLVRLDLPPFDHEKIDEKLLVEYLR